LTVKIFKELVLVCNLGSKKEEQKKVKELAKELPFLS
jgi:hypothetical protein